MKQTILIVDDEAEIRTAFSEYLGQEGYVVKEAGTLARARELVAFQRFDAVLLDHILPDGHGVDWISELRETCPDAAIVVITGLGDVPLAVEAMRRGADNFFTKPVSLGDLYLFLRKSLELSALRRKDAVQQRLAKTIAPYFGNSAAMKAVLEQATAAAENDAAVLLHGESGTGKGLLAHWIHNHGPRRAAPFVDVNCSSLRGELLASELFGHARGAFTSAVQERQGLIEVADGGTLFLDEIGDMDPAVQAQFLKVIEEKSYRRLGEAKVRRSEFRLICATNKDLPEEIRKGRFREDLYFRLYVFPIFVPPLRDRQEDVAGLVQHVLRELGRPDAEVPPPVMDHLSANRWPGNVRELRNVLERALLLARREPLDLKHFPGIAPDKAEAPCAPQPGAALERLEQEYITSAINRSAGDLEKAAEELGISRATLYRKLKKFKESV